MSAAQRVTHDPVSMRSLTTSPRQAMIYHSMSRAKERHDLDLSATDLESINAQYRTSVLKVVDTSERDGRSLCLLTLHCVSAYVVYDEIHRTIATFMPDSFRPEQWRRGNTGIAKYIAQPKRRGIFSDPDRKIGNVEHKASVKPEPKKYSINYLAPEDADTYALRVPASLRHRFALANWYRQRIGQDQSQSYRLFYAQHYSAIWDEVRNHLGVSEAENQADPQVNRSIIVDLKMYRTSLVQWYQQHIGMECITPSKKACRRFYVEYYVDIWAEVRKYIGEPEQDATETARSWMAVHGWTITQNGWVRDRDGKPRFRGIKNLFMELRGFYKPTDTKPVEGRS